jgi:hypothetical protein
MPILTGFFNCHATNPKGKVKYDALTEEQRYFFHNELPPLLMATGVGAVTPTSRGIIANRLEFISETALRDYAKDGDPNCHPVAAVAKLLEPFDGVVSNVANESTGEFMHRHSQCLIKWTERAARTTMARELRELEDACETT